MGPPRCIKDVKKLIGCTAALNRFISRLGEKRTTFFKLLKKTGKFEWTEEAKNAFKKLKAYLTSSPILTPPKKHEAMMLYIAATNMVVIAAIVVEREEEGHIYKVQWSIYYMSEVLSDSKIKYPHVQKLLYALLITSRKLWHYFDSHKITVVADFPLRDILHNRDATGCISKWVVELGALNINFTPHKSNQVSSTRGFRSQVDRDTTTNTRCYPRPLEKYTLMDHSS
jgi:hypothetical protein